jgi:hypothetical protein
MEDGAADGAIGAIVAAEDAIFTPKVEDGE